MNMLRNELAHNTHEQARAYLADALAIVAELDPPVELAPVVLSKAIDLLSAKSITFDKVEAALPNGFQIPGR